ncbi:hypothetical protein K466DRAFT_391837 [Polyporus arcularius HHB13444]|uniref:Uncharacterized protein n=1 Tax=Polyporus arcularius HHB13444 TaxID=1314778 RepID=A0A5C3PLZ3_9APHY|nr:hypothetical protein K466DRAFT_391837 [Polyporus arcularius HHB13444]
MIVRTPWTFECPCEVWSRSSQNAHLSHDERPSADAVSSRPLQALEDCGVAPSGGTHSSRIQPLKPTISPKDAAFLRGHPLEVTWAVYTCISATHRRLTATSIRGVHGRSLDFSPSSEMKQRSLPHLSIVEFKRSVCALRTPVLQRLHRYRPCLRRVSDTKVQQRRTHRVHRRLWLSCNCRNVSSTCFRLRPAARRAREPQDDKPFFSRNTRSHRMEGLCANRDTSI